ncbi:MAG: hypothetical protein NVSMB18_11790 [Acetobacteraceae bacterium]
MKLHLAIPGLMLALAGCEAPSGPPLVSAQFPPGTGVVNRASQPQPLNSLPPGAANFSSAPGATEPNFASLQFRLF